MHRKKVETLREKIKKNQKMVLSSALSSTLRANQYKEGYETIDLSPFNEILQITESFALVEPKVTFDALCRATLAKGLLPPVVPEFKQITLGGAVNGAALESSSHLYGQFADTCEGYELILGDGSLLWASPEENAELFYAVSGSYGTLAILTLIKVQLIKSKPYVFITFQEKFPEAKKTCAFVDAIAYSPQKIITMEGEMRNKATSPLIKQRSYSKWFFQIAENPPPFCTMPLYDYLFRYDLGAFWMGKYLAPPNFAFRLLLNRLYRAYHLYQGIYSLPLRFFEKRFFVHDFYIPEERAKEAFLSFCQSCQIFPMWLCPVLGTTTPQFLSPHYGKNAFCNIGIYGKTQDPIALAKKLEQEVLAFGGRKMLYSLTYYGKESFEKEYHHAHYNFLRKKFSAENAFPNLYSKVCQKSTAQKNIISETT